MTESEGFDAAAEDMEMWANAQAGIGEVCKTIKVRPNPPIIPLREVIVVPPIEPEEQIS